MRKSRHISQYKLADELKLSRSAISAYELNKREPDFDTLNKIADYFKVSIDYLLGRAENEPVKKRIPYLSNLFKRDIFDEKELTEAEWKVFTIYILLKNNIKGAKELIGA